jgi:hypothetical protein
MPHATTAGRRDLRFARFDDLMADLDLLGAGHETISRWTLGQICRHLSATVRLSRRTPGPSPVELVSPDRRVDKSQFLAIGRFTEGLPVPFPALVPPEGLDDADEVERLRRAVAAFAADPGPFADHPFLGPLTKDEWERFHCHHAAHHLSFARPRPGA